MKHVDNVILRAARGADVKEIASLSRTQVESGLPWSWTPERVQQQLKDTETMVLVASVQDRMVGFAIMRFGDKQAHLMLLAVRAAYRRSGIASSLLAWLDKSCRTAGMRRIRLEVRASNWSARAFYRQRGYQFFGQIAGYYRGQEAAVVMTRQLVVDGRPVGLNNDLK